MCAVTSSDCDNRGGSKAQLEKKNCEHVEESSIRATTPVYGASLVVFVELQLVV